MTGWLNSLKLHGFFKGIQVDEKISQTSQLSARYDWLRCGQV